MHEERCLDSPRFQHYGRRYPMEMLGLAVPAAAKDRSKRLLPFRGRRGGAWKTLWIFPIPIPLYFFHQRRRVYPTCRRGLPVTFPFRSSETNSFIQSWTSSVHIWGYPYFVFSLPSRNKEEFFQTPRLVRERFEDCLWRENFCQGLESG